MTREQAIRELVKTKELSTNLLKPLGISFDSFLTLAQLPKAKADAIVEKFIAKLEKEL